VERHLKNIYPDEFHMGYFKWYVLIQEYKLHTTCVRCFKYLFSLFEPDCCITLGKDHMTHDNRLAKASSPWKPDRVFFLQGNELL
jgi:hypothetical protein